MIINTVLLTHPNIPKPLHGTAPRSILGKEWWDNQRNIAYKENDYHCMACGCHKSHDRFHNWLEAHEDYSIDYKSGKVKLNRIVALCHSCHNFIHSGRLFAMWSKAEVDTNKALYILKRGFHILKQNDLQPFIGTCSVYLKILEATNGNCDSVRDRVIELEESHPKIDIQQDWTKWHIEIDGVNHYGKFKSMHEWQKYYS